MHLANYYKQLLLCGNYCFQLQLVVVMLCCILLNWRVFTSWSCVHVCVYDDIVYQYLQDRGCAAQASGDTCYAEKWRVSANACIARLVFHAASIDCIRVVIVSLCLVSHAWTNIQC